MISTVTQSLFTKRGVREPDQPSWLVCSLPHNRHVQMTFFFFNPKLSLESAYFL